MAIEAAVWRDEQRQQRDKALAYYVATLSRAKRVPPLRVLLNIKPARKLEGDELEQRRREHREMTRNVNVAMLGQRLAAAQAARGK